MKTITIHTEAGADIGRGHVVRMGHLAALLGTRGHAIQIWTNPAGQSYFKNVGLDSFTHMKKVVVNSDITIVDLMNNDNRYLAELRPRCEKLVVIVGAGHTITPATRWIADLVVYQNADLSDLWNWVPGEKILQGLEHIMVDPHYAELEIDLKGEQRRFDFATYFGGGIHERFARGLLQELRSRGHEIITLGQPDQHWDNEPYDVLQNATMYVGSMGMMAYEAILTRTKPILFCRSEDHQVSARELEGRDLAYTLHLLSRPTKETPVDTAANMIDDIYKNYKPKNWRSYEWRGQSLDGKGLYRVAREILKDA